MAALLEPFLDAGAFAPRSTLPLSATTVTRFGVFGARERRPSALAGAEPRRTIVCLFVGEQEVRMTYTNRRAGLPSWAKPALSSISERWGIEHGWNGYDAKPTEPRLVAQLLNHLSAVMGDEAAAPTLVPLADSGVQAEWHRNACDLEIVVPADEPARYYFFCEATAEEEEGDLKANYARVQDLIALLQ